MERLQSLLGFVVLLGLCWIVSENRRKISARTVLAGVATQVALCLLLLRFPPVSEKFALLNGVVLALESATTEGTSFIFGYLGGAALPFEEPFPGASYIFAFRALPLVLIVSALSSLLFYWRVLPLVVRGLSWALQRALGIGGCEALASAANIFIGMVESPILIRPYLRNFSRSEMFAVMTVGMATIAGTVMVLYAQVLSAVIDDAISHILVASIISAPAALTVAKIMIPQTKPSLSGELTAPEEAHGALDAIVRGTSQGLTLLLNIVAMIIVCLALVALVNILLGLLPDIGGEPITLQRILGTALAPVAWLLGIPWAEARVAGALIGTKTILNEMVAYVQLSQLPADALSERSRVILVYALCGFANFGSLGIMLGGMGAMVEGEQRRMLISLGLKSIVAGTIATCLTGALVGLFYSAGALP